MHKSRLQRGEGGGGGGRRGWGGGATGTVFVFNEPTDNGLWGPWRDMTQIALSSDWD